MPPYEKGASVGEKVSNKADFILGNRPKFWRRTTHLDHATPPRPRQRHDRDHENVSPFLTNFRACVLSSRVRVLPPLQFEPLRRALATTFRIIAARVPDLRLRLDNDTPV